MKKSELLSPAGSFESAVAAIQNGSDALYLGGMRFGARAFAHNFDEEKLKEVIAYAHAYGVRVYITLNTLIYDSEWEEVCEYIEMLYKNNVDALIVQDLGVLSYIRNTYPDFEVHASTQMHVCNTNALHFLKEEGVQRAVLAREVSIHEIPSFVEVGIELEVFVHGALCVAYSGQCLMSYMVGGRSGNRGACAQSCRMPYTLCEFEGNKQYGKPAYLLSLKDLNTVEHIQQLQQLGIASFKIEGRMKKSEYVGYITSLYRKACDDPHFTLNGKALEKAKLLFHRGYTKGFLYEQKGSDLYNPYRPNHIGIEVGKVISSTSTRIKVKLKEDVYQGDGIRILQDHEDIGFKLNLLYINDLLVNHGEKGMLVEIECHEKIKEGSIILKTSDPLLEKEIRSGYEKIKRRIPIAITFHAQEGKPLKIMVEDGEHSVVKESVEIVEKAKTHAAQEKDIIEKLRKVNDTIFYIEKMDVQLEGSLFISIKVINQLRRDAVDELYRLRATSMERIMHPYPETQCVPIQKEAAISVKVNREDQLLAALEMKILKIYVKEYALYEKYKQYSEVLLCSSRVEKKGYHEVTMIQDIGGIHALPTFECDTSLNVCNQESVLFLMKKGAQQICVSWEMHKEDILAMANALHEQYRVQGLLQCVVYGRCEVMVSEHCPIHASLLDNDKKNCQLCRTKTFALKDKFNNLYPMDNDRDCRMHLYDFKVRNELDKVKEYLAHGVSVRLDFTFEKAEEVKNILQKVRSIKSQQPKLPKK